MIDIARADSITDGWMKRDELVWLATQAQRCRNIIEIGSYAGRSTRALADHCPGTVYAVDPWDGDYFRADGTKHRKVDTRQYDAFRANLADHIEAGRCVPMRGTIVDAEAELRRRIPGGADLVFIDGDHRREQLLIDIAKGRGLLRHGGILSGHDYGKRDWPDVKAVVDEIFAYASVERCRSIWWVTL